MSDISVTLRSMFLTSDPDIQEKLMVEADKLQKAVQTLVEQINTLGYKKTPWEIKQFLLESSPLGLSAEQIKKCYTPITECNFGVRIENCLAAQNMELLGDLVRMDEKTLSNMPNFGRKSTNETKEILSELGLGLGMFIPNWEILKTEHKGKS